MCFEVFYAHIDSFNHVEELRLENQGVAWVVEHTSSVLELLEVPKPLVDSVCDAE